MELPDLPNDVFLLVTRYLSTRDIVLCRMPSRKWYNAFTNERFIEQILKRHFPLAKETRQLQTGSIGALYWHGDKRDAIDWRRVFDKVAARYHALQGGAPRSVEKLKTKVSTEFQKAHLFPVANWERHYEFSRNGSDFYYSEFCWTYEDGLLIYPHGCLQKYILREMETGATFDIPFDLQDRIVRRIRLHDKLLVIEWAELKPYHMLNETEVVHRHFVTTYDIIRSLGPLSFNDGSIQIIYRNELKLHFLGFPLNRKERFFTVHNSTHFAVYIWQFNRSAWGEDEPIESLAVWNISDSSTYRPSLDPSGRAKPTDHSGPKIVKRLNFKELEFFGVRQGPTPVLTRLELDDDHGDTLYLVEENDILLRGVEVGHNGPRMWKVRVVGIPLGDGPFWQDACHDPGCGGIQSSWEGARKAPCFRYANMPFTLTASVHDPHANLVFSLLHHFTSIRPTLEISGLGWTSEIGGELTEQVGKRGKIFADERWVIGENDQQQIVVLHFDR
ncbi:MAG: hypothetical protein M1827_005535 [Pycnora praestabilis]|nr:MAG: hypothetical protein M1827_005535 [Pycnora praestabilis]